MAKDEMGEDEMAKNKMGEDKVARGLNDKRTIWQEDLVINGRNDKGPNARGQIAKDKMGEDEVDINRLTHQSLVLSPETSEYH